MKHAYYLIERWVGAWQRLERVAVDSARRVEWFVWTQLFVHFFRLVGGKRSLCVCLVRDGHRRRNLHGRFYVFAGNGGCGGCIVAYEAFGRGPDRRSGEQPRRTRRPHFVGR